MLRNGQHVVVIQDEWTDKLNRRYMSTTYTFIDDDWEKHEGSSTGEEEAKCMEGIMVKHRQVGHVTAVVTDCKPLMVKAGRLLEAKKLTALVGCAGHRLQSSTGVGFYW